VSTSLPSVDTPTDARLVGMEETIEHLSIFLEYVPGGSVGRIVRTHGKVNPQCPMSYELR
jgi:hypothetical protein